MQVSGLNNMNVPASRNVGTKINTQVSGSKSKATLGYRKITDVKKSQVSGQNKLTNYMGINSEGMDIFHAKKIIGYSADEDGNLYDAYAVKSHIFYDADTRQAEQEYAANHKPVPGRYPIGFTVEVESLSVEGSGTLPEDTVVATLNCTGAPVGNVSVTFNSDAEAGSSNGAFKLVMADHTVVIGSTELGAGTYKVSLKARDDAGTEEIQNVEIVINRSEV